MSRRSSHHGRRALRVVLWGLAAGHVVEALVLRRRRRRVAALSDAETVASPRPDVLPDLGVVKAPGAAVDRRTLAAAKHDMKASGAEVVDLVPGDLPVERAVRLLRRVDQVRLPNPLYSPGGAHEVVVWQSSLGARMGASAGPVGARDRGELLRTTVRAQRYAPTTAVMRLATDLRAAAQTPYDRWRELDEATAGTRTIVDMPAVLLGLEGAHLLALTAGALVAPMAGLAALGTWLVQPMLVFGGGGSRRPVEATGPRPRDLGPATLLRLPRRWASLARTVGAGQRQVRASRAEQAASPPPEVPHEGELFEPRRAACPSCGSEALVGMIDTPDLLQGKPGTFHLDRCTGCGHVFQNPALSLAGLEYYYRDFYDGPCEEQWEQFFAAGARGHFPRMETMARFTEPQAWLDVGTGHGHFCLVARQEWPEAVFDGLDMGESVEEAERRGWVDTAYRGMFPELADGLPRSYDVVSMFHYLEHARDPWRELTAAAKVVEPGGYLMIEVPDPESPWGRRLGRYWYPWLQPQHQHMLPCDNLVAALEDVGFEVISVERAAATMSNDLIFAVGMAVQRVASSPHAPWLPPASLTHRLKRAAAVTAALPAATVAALLDQVKDRLLDPAAPGNAYRLVARRR